MKPETVIRWHRSGFRRYWTWKSRRRRRGRPPIDPDVRALIRKMSEANPRWGAPRVHGELRKIGIDVSQAAVSKYMVRHRKPVWSKYSNAQPGQQFAPSQRWLESAIAVGYV